MARWTEDREREQGRGRYGEGERTKEGWRSLTGKGPKGYKRSDERIRDELSERIARSWVNAEEVEVMVEKGEVTLTGLVRSREEKRTLEDIADDVFGVEDVNNHLKIRREEGTRSHGAAASAGQSTQSGQRAQQAGPQPGARH